ncbi:putative polysaccharide biosynthesis protein [Paenisporosarcina cavernae]|uniref:Polysaccharide biosynthesis protein n=1 Tax=Paenisporosarcina cavernae TaxID=2320858 RepID=A0A385YYP8_9BACL|nr:polysaccharide biosynthesis protein [Paenisporosarcina cavernae]AYC30693.1 polysaccharide biosynthesis protein [Paenisporosarcina cavernae]
MSKEWTMKKFMEGAVLLTFAAIVVKILSAVYRVPFQNMVGDKGFYIYQQVYPFIGVFVVWTSYGFAVSISKLLAESQSQKERAAILHVSFLFLCLLSVSFFVALFFGAEQLASFMGDRNLQPLLRVSAFVALCMPLLAILKADFQAKGNMAPIAYGQVVEQLVRVVFILSGTYFVIQSGKSLYTAGTFAVGGALVGEIAGIILLILFVGMKSWKWNTLFAVRTYNWSILKRLLFLSISISFSSLVILFFQLIDSFTILRYLIASGLEQALAMESKGIYDRGQPIVQMGILLATTLSLSIVPLVAHASRRDVKRSADTFIQLAMKVAILFGVASSLGLMLIIPYANEMLFETNEGSAVLFIFVGQIIPLSIILPLTSVLQGRGKVGVPILLFVVGIVAKWIGNVLLLPNFGVMGAALASNGAFLLIAILLYVYYRRSWNTAFAGKKFYVTLALASILMSIVVITWELLGDYWLFDGLPNRLQATLVALSSVAFGAVVFMLVVMKSKIMKEKEWYLIPYGRRIAKAQLWLSKKKGTVG